MIRAPVLLAFLPALLGPAALRPAEAAPGAPVLKLVVEVGPIGGRGASSKTLTFEVAARKRTTWYDVQDALEHHVRGVSLTELVAMAKAPKGADAVVFDFADGMRIRLVKWKAYEAVLAQPTRQFPDQSGWPLYLGHCQPCHGLGGQGAKRAPDFLANMDAYRRVPPLAVTDRSQHPSLHEKVKGFTEGTMPVLNHVSNDEISTLWRWLHAIHRGATK